MNKRHIAFAGLVALLAGSFEAGCALKCLPHPEFENRPLAASYRLLEDRVNAVNHAFYPIGLEIGEYAGPRHTENRLLRLDEKVQHVNAEIILKEVPPEKIQCQLDDIEARISEVKTARAMGGGL